MSDANKRKNHNEVNKKSKSLVKLGVKADANERYDSYGYKIETKKNSIPIPDRQKMTPGRDKKRTGESVYVHKDIEKKSEKNTLREAQDSSKEVNKKNGNKYINSSKRTSNIEKNEKISDGKEINKKSENPSRKTERNRKSVYSNSDKTKNIEKNDLSKGENKELPESNDVANNKLDQNDRDNLKSKNIIKKQSKNTKDVAGEEIRPHERRLKEKKPARNKKIEKFLKISVLLLLIVGVVCLFWFAGSSDDEIRKAFLSTGSIERTISSNVCVIKNETAIVSDFSGKVIAKVNEGDRVKAGTVVAYIVKPEYESELVALRKIEDKISAAQKASSYVENEHMELSNLNSQIYDSAKELAMLSAVNSSFSEYTELKQNMENLFETKHEILMNVETTDSYINELKRQRTEILDNLNNYMSELVTEEAGIVSFYTDSNCNEASEKMIQISNYLNNKGQADNIISESNLCFYDNSMKNMQGVDVTNGQIVARVTPDVKYYLSASVSNSDASSFYQGKQIKVRSKDRTFSVEGIVEDVLTYGDKTYILVESSSGNAGVVSSRIMEAEIVVESAEGLKVPKRALTEWDSARLTARISILRSNYVSYVFVNILAEDGEYAIIAPSNGFVSEEDTGEDITSVRVNDIYVVNYEKVTEGQIIGG